MNQDIKQAYKNYLNTASGAERYNLFKKYLYGEADSLVASLYQLLLLQLQSKKNLSILDIGGGDGKRLNTIMNLLKKDGISSDAVLVEPSSALLSLFQDLGNTIRIQEKLLEDFESEETFDVIFLIHSIYTFKDDSYLKKIKNLLKTDGLLVVVSNHPQSFLSQLKKIADSESVIKRKEITSVCEDLEKNGFTYHTETFDTMFEGTLDNSIFTPKGKEILEWITLSSFQNISEDIKQKAFECFKSNTQDGKIFEKEMVIFAKR